MTTLLLWRHGNTTWNSEKRYQGHSDSPLSDLGRTQAVAAAPLLAARGPTAIVSSDLSRCLDTAATLAELTGLPVRRDDRLRERHYGQWQGLTATEVAQRYPEAYARQRAGGHDLGHGIEPVIEVSKRMGEALREIGAGAAGATTVVVTHGGAARYGLFDLLGWPHELLASVVALGNCHYSELRLDPDRGWVLQAHNVGAVPAASGYE